MFAELRQMVLTTEPAKLGLTPDAKNRVWGVVMEELYGDTVVSLVCLADGTVSIYFSNGGGFIGMGEHPGPRTAAEALIRQASDFFMDGTMTKDFPLPAAGQCFFYLKTFDGDYSVTVAKNDIISGASPLRPLYASAQAVITQCRLVDEGKNRTVKSK